MCAVILLSYSKVCIMILLYALCISSSLLTNPNIQLAIIAAGCTNPEIKETSPKGLRFTTPLEKNLQQKELHQLFYKINPAVKVEFLEQGKVVVNNVFGTAQEDALYRVKNSYFLALPYEQPEELHTKIKKIKKLIVHNIPCMYATVVFFNGKISNIIAEQENPKTITAKESDLYKKLWYTSDISLVKTQKMSFETGDIAELDIDTLDLKREKSLWNDEKTYFYGCYKELQAKPEDLVVCFFYPEKADFASAFKKYLDL